MKTLSFALVAATVSLAASAASAAERLPFGPPSEPTIFGHRIDSGVAPVLQRLETVRQVRPAPRADGRTASEPTIWGHRLPENDPRRFPDAE